MFYMPGTRMLFGDAKDSCDGKFLAVIPCFIIGADMYSSYQAWP
jgi:hypothetical protein